MRVLLYQSAKGLFSPSGCYRSNLAILRHLASRGHVVQQTVYAYEREIHEYVAEKERKGIKIDVSRERLNVPLSRHAVVKIKVARFTMSSGVGVVAVDAANADKLFSKYQVQSLTRAFVEGGLSNSYSTLKLSD
jgi:hypothetical protein